MEIANLKVYNDNMRKSLLDKAYFLSFVDSDTFIDFGCADGSLLKHIHEMFPDKKLIGYDISPEMLQIEEFLSKVPNNYVIDYFYEFIMPQTQQGILKDFNILLKDTTHFKCILRKI